MSEDRFFQQVKSVMSDYQPEVPGHVYQGVRKKMWWSNFMRFDLTRLNIWYISLAIGVTTAIVMNTGEQPSRATDKPAAPASNQAEVVEATTDAPAASKSSVNNESQVPTEAVTVKNTVAEKTVPVTSKPITEEIVVSDVASAEETKVVEQPKAVEHQQIQNEAQAPAKANKRGLKVKTYSAEGAKK
jgi:hypothetical protein